jgi:hypothetical protein
MNNEQLNTQIDELWAQTKAGNLPREQRFEAIEGLTEEYATANGKRPPAHILDRLATLCLYEEMSDKRKNKMQAEESPVMSGNQYRRRKEGKHVRSELATGEVSMKRASEYGTDMRNYSEPTRRKLTTDEALILDQKLPLSEAQAERYAEQAKNSEVIVSYVN